MNAVTIARAEAASAEVLAALHARAFDEVWDAPTLVKLMAMPGTFALLASRDDVPLGFILMRVIADEAEILTLAVDPQSRRQGVASALLAAGMETALTHGAARAFLEVSVTNQAAIALYTRAGWREAGRRPRYYADGSDALLLSLNPLSG